MDSTVMSNISIFVKYFALSIIHLLVNELVQHFKTFTLKNHSHINWLYRIQTAACIALKYCNHKKLYLHFLLGYSSVDKTQALHSLILLLSVWGMFICTAIYWLIHCSLLISCYKQLYYPDYVIDKCKGRGALAPS